MSDLRLTAVPDGATRCETLHPTYRRQCTLLADHRGDHFAIFPSGRELRWHNHRATARYGPAET